VLPYHVALDQARESGLGANAIGTTKLGIGPAYEDKVARRGLRLIDLADPDKLKDKLKKIADFHNFMLIEYYKQSPINYELVYSELNSAWARLEPMLVDVAGWIREANAQNKKLLFEGAQGSSLDIDHGTYPYVTSSNTTAGAACCGAGLGPLHIGRIIGVVKAYATRVGSGPFSTELTDGIGKHLADRGNEFGSTTGRPRRCGWFDAVILRRNASINSLTELCLTKLDVLDELDEIKICIGYRGQSNDGYRVRSEDEVIEPTYITLPGWKESTVGVKLYSDLPRAAQDYIAALEEHVGLSVTMVSVSPDRDAMIMREGSVD
jgi:adenylosuccinate synthase